MKTHIFALGCTLAISGLAASSLAADFQTRYDVETGYTRLNFTDTPAINYDALHLKGSVQFLPYLGAELEGALGVGSRNTVVSGFTVKSHLNWTLAGYGVASYPVFENAEVLARAGYVHAQLRASAGFGTVTDDNGGFAIGVGFRYFFWGGHTGLRADYTRYRIGGSDANTFGIALTHRF